MESLIQDFLKLDAKQFNKKTESAVTSTARKVTLGSVNCLT